MHHAYISWEGLMMCMSDTYAPDLHHAARNKWKQGLIHVCPNSLKPLCDLYLVSNRDTLEYKHDKVSLY